MFSIGDSIIYGSYGVCKIVGIKDMKVGEEVSSYYVLEPVFENNLTFYLPIGNEVIKEKMYHTLTTEEIYALIKAMPDEDTIWIENDNERREKYKQILAGNDHTALVKLIKTLHQRQQELKENGKKLYISDERFLKDAEKVLYDEFAHVLDIKQEEVLPLIFEQIEANERVRNEDSVM
ncbi:MAG: CarD family transcriptional regulator [Ruminiclostridium sp.]|nr:CarD family transcriptional regulator [Ruminiclostridium sp.]